MDALKLNAILEKHNLRKTELRRLILKKFIQSGNEALSQKNFEDILDNVDRVSVYRTLKSFEGKGIIHQAMDGSAPAKYAYCLEECTTKEHHHKHAHFHCESCESTICVEVADWDSIELPLGYEQSSMEILFQGICPECH